MLSSHPFARVFCANEPQRGRVQRVSAYNVRQLVAIARLRRPRWHAPFYSLYAAVWRVNARSFAIVSFAKKKSQSENLKIAIRLAGRTHSEYECQVPEFPWPFLSFFSSILFPLSFFLCYLSGLNKHSIFFVSKPLPLLSYLLYYHFT